MFDWDNMRIKVRSPDDWHASPVPKPRSAEELRRAARELQEKRDTVLGVVVKKKYTKNER
ncbi:MAG: hypothetical protein EHJ95_06085 [Methanobacteriota archaeon]|nr:MAG: hypothetical protein EHJ95_06085 [Euryarchaeota archaeon]